MPTYYMKFESAILARRRRARTLAVLTLVLLLSLTACNALSQQDMQTAQALQDLGGSLTDLRQVQQGLQDQVDSLRLVVVRQDATIRTLANLAGVVIPSR
ncbi:MAG: hypothetical protein ABIT38_22460 [Gemmatimonadaceae bacterium]